MSKLLLFATFSEAESTIGKLKAIPDLHSYKTVYPDGSIPTLYHYEGGYIALSGMGIHQAMMTIAQYASNIEEIVNFGFAGLLKESEDRPHNLPLGSILKISKVHKYIPHLHL